MYVDFNHIPNEHRAIDARLWNWAAWATVTGGRFTQPMFKFYRSEEVWDDVKQQARSAPVDASDAIKIERAVCMLPENHRWSTVWFYRIKAKPTAVCRALGVSKDGLARLVKDSRQMLVNRGV